MKKAVILALCVMLSCQSGAFALSDWAKDESVSANRYGLVTKSILEGETTDNITREEFCELAINLYRNMGGEMEKNVRNPFTDTNNPAVILAYSLGIINGKTDTLFYPDAPITRQEIAKIIMLTVNKAENKTVTEDEVCEICHFEDFSDIHNWATEYVRDAVKHEIINGVSKTRLFPLGSATREQSLVIMNRAYEGFAEDKTKYDIPKVYGLEHGKFSGDTLAFNWDEVSGAQEYVVLFRDSGNNIIKSRTVQNPYITLDVAGTVYGPYSVIVGAKISDYSYIYTDAQKLMKTSGIYVDKYPTYQDKVNRVFPQGVAFTSYDTAKASMKTIDVPVWGLDGSGAKYASKMTLEVNVNLADDVMRIFTEIYNDPERFPIKDVGGFSWRETAFGGVSEHSYGTCVDINWDENYYCHASTGEAITGSFWKPYENPYSIPKDGSVVRIFKKYGWQWGGDAWTRLRDYMHFTYLGK